MFTSSDRKAISSCISKADAVKKDLITANSKVSTLDSRVNTLTSRVNTAVSKISSASSTAVGAKARADEAMSTAVGAKERADEAMSTTVGVKERADEAMEGVMGLRSDRDGLSNTLNSTMKFLDEVAANVNDNLPAMKTSIQNLQNDMNAIKLSVLVQTCSELGTQQGDLRLYTSEECDAMNGDYRQSGECIKKEGGSFSYDCGMLYKGKNVGSKKVNTTAVKNNKGMEYGTGMEYGEVQQTNKRKNNINIIHDDGGREENREEPTYKPTYKKNNSNYPANSFNTSKPFNWSKEPGGQSDVIGTAFRVAAKMGLRASIVSSTKESGWSLPIGSEYEYMDALDAADNMFIQFLGNNSSPGEAAREAAREADQTEYRMRVLSASLEAAHRLGLGSKNVNQTSKGWSLPLGQYSPTEAIAADNAFQQTIAGAATPFRPTEQEGRAAADAAQFIARLRKIAFEMGLGLKSNGVLAYHGYSLPLGQYYSPTAATAADLKFKEVYSAGASPADAAAAALLKAKALEPQTKVNALEPQTKVNALEPQTKVNALEPQTSGPVAANAKAASGANAAAKDRWGAWTGTLFNRLGGRRKRTTRGKSRRRGTRRSRR